MPKLNVFLLIYGILMIAMGIHGFVSKGSVASLVAAGSVGAIIIGTVALYKTNPRPARIIGAVVSLLTLGMEGSKLLNKPVFYPHGLAAGLSVIAFVWLGAGHLLAQRDRPRRDEQG